MKLASWSILFLIRYASLVMRTQDIKYIEPIWGHGKVPGEALLKRLREIEKSELKPDIANVEVYGSSIELDYDEDTTLIKGLLFSSIYKYGNFMFIISRNELVVLKVHSYWVETD